LKMNFEFTESFAMCGLLDDLQAMLLLTLMTREMLRMQFVDLMVKMAGESRFLITIRMVVEVVEIAVLVTVEATAEVTVEVQI